MSGRCAARMHARGPRASAPAPASGRRHVPDPPGEQLLGPVVRLGLHVLRQREGHGAGLGRVGEHAHRGEQRGRQLFGPVDPVEEPGDRPERVVDRHVVRARVLQLLQHRAGDPGREDVAGQQQHREAVDGRASAAPVTMLVEPGPIEAVQARVCSRLLIRAKPAAAWTMPCSLRAR